MDKIRLQDVVNFFEYEKVREARRAHVIELKRRRRVPVGHHLSFVFENRDTVLYQIQAQIVADAASGTEQRLAIFANIDVWTNLISLAVQMLATGPLLMRWGAGLPLRVAAGLLGAGLLLLARWPSLPMLKAIQALRRASHYALERPALNLLFTVVGVEEKYKAKGFIDTFIYRLGDQVGAWSYGLMGLLGLGIVGTSVVAVGLSAVSIGNALWLGRRQEAMAAELRSPGRQSVATTEPALAAE